MRGGGIPPSLRRKISEPRVIDGVLVLVAEIARKARESFPFSLRILSSHLLRAQLPRRAWYDSLREPPQYPEPAPDHARAISLDQSAAPLLSEGAVSVIVTAGAAKKHRHQ